jgi:hypothetical protein
MKEIRTEIDIQASPGKAWQVLTDLDKYVEWNPFLHHAAGSVELGGKVDITFKSGSKDMSLHCTVVKLDPTRALTWSYHVGLPFLFSGEHSFVMEPAGEGRVHFVDREVFRGLLVPFFVNEKDTGDFEAMDRALKTRVEAIM